MTTFMRREAARQERIDRLAARFDTPHRINATVDKLLRIQGLFHNATIIVDGDGQITEIIRNESHN